MEKQSGLRVCCDRIIPDAVRPARAMARNARISTALHGTDYKTPRELFRDIDPREVIPPSRMAVIDRKKWEIGMDLKCRFIGGTRAQQEKTIEIASKWMDYANINITFVKTKDEHIRIAFMEGNGSWSALGTDALEPYFPGNEPTMNYGWLDENTDEEEWRRVVTHEFGHALGCVHEHQSPNVSLNWDKEAVYAYFSGPPNNWDKATIDHNILEKYSPNGVSATLFDPKSIMLYMFPPELFTDHMGTNNNTGVSEKDKAFIRQLYPK